MRIDGGGGGSTIEKFMKQKKVQNQKHTRGVKLDNL